MLNLNNPIVYTDSERAIIDSVLSDKSKGGERWNDHRTYDIKHKISESCLREQHCYCAFCECFLKKGDAPIEHISPKSVTPDFVFEPENLVVSCTSCNSPVIKGEKPTISGTVVSEYRNNSFAIVHPRLDNPDEHIVFIDSDRTVFDLNNCTTRGKFTIKFFDWDNLNAYRARVATAKIRPLPFDIEKMVNEISTYKPKQNV